jgi:hypothetical protein
MRQQNRQAVTKIGIVRRLGDAGPEYFSDERDRRGQRYPNEALIWSLMLGCVGGLASLREVEALTAGLRGDVRRTTRIEGRYSDTKLRDVLLALDLEESRAALIRGVKAEHRRGNLEPEVLPLSVVAIDGKCLGKLDSWDDPNVQAVWPGGGQPYGLARVHRAHLVSSRACVCIDQAPIPGDTNELGAICAFTRQLIKTYKRTDLFEAIAVDAGNASLKHASLIHSHDLGYIMALKGPAGDIYQEALRTLGGLPSEQAEHTRTTRERGARITCRVWRATVQGYLGWTHARQLIRVERRVENDRGEVSCGNRCFVTNLVPGRLTSPQWLTLIRMYWRCENEGHWTADVVWREDARRLPWIRTPHAVYALSTLRMVALNVLAVLRRMSRREYDSRPLPWRQVTRLAYSALAEPAISTRERFSCD